MMFPLGPLPKHVSKKPTETLSNTDGLSRLPLHDQKAIGEMKTVRCGHVLSKIADYRELKSLFQEVYKIGCCKNFTRTTQESLE